MIGFIDRLLSRHGPHGSKDDAKARLKMVLMHDQVDLTPAQMEAMKAEILDVVARYLEVEDDRVDVRLERFDDGLKVTSSVPVRRVLGRPVHVG